MRSYFKRFLWVNNWKLISFFKVPLPSQLLKETLRPQGSAEVDSRSEMSTSQPKKKIPVHSQDGECARSVPSTIRVLSAPAMYTSCFCCFCQWSAKGAKKLEKFTIVLKYFVIYSYTLANSSSSFFCLTVAASAWNTYLLCLSYIPERASLEEIYRMKSRYSQPSSSFYRGRSSPWVPRSSEN